MNMTLYLCRFAFWFEFNGKCTIVSYIQERVKQRAFIPLIFPIYDDAVVYGLKRV